MWPQANLACTLLAFFQLNRVCLISEDSTFPLQAFTQIPRPDLGAYGKELSTGVSFLQQRITEVPFSTEEGWMFWSFAPAVCSPQMVSTLTRDRFAKLEGGVAGCRRVPIYCFRCLIQMALGNIIIHIDMSHHQHKSLIWQTRKAMLQN